MNFPLTVCSHMFYLTPQERQALAWVLTIFIVGTIVSVGLRKNIPMVAWVKGAHQPRHTPLLDINKATVQQLDKLPGIGVVIAQRIVNFRSQQGEYTSIEQLKSVKGMTKRNYAKVESKVYVGVKSPGEIHP